MNPLLIYFREECIELWSLDTNGRLVPVMYNSSNQLPLYFLLSGEEILMNKYAKDAYLNNEANSFGDFWKNLENNSISYDRFASNNSFSTLMPYVLKEAVLPLIAKSHFHTNLSDLLKETNTAVLFDSFVEEKHKEIILNLFFEIIGFDPNSILSFDYFDSFREIKIKYKAITQSDSFILANISCGNFYFHLIGKNSPLHLAKKVLEGKGQDPILDCVLDFLVEIAQAKGSMLKHIEIKKELKNDAIAILNKIPDGLVLHTVRNNNLDVNPLKISFHKNEIEGRINNRQSLNFIQNEFDSFRKQNNAEQLPIFLGGEIINRSVFRDFFNNTYSKVNFEEDDFNSNAIISCMNRLLTKENLISDNRQALTTPIQKDKKATEGIESCNAKLKEIEDIYTDLLFKANQSESKGDLKHAIDFLNQAITLKGNNEDLTKKVKKLTFDLQFKTDSATPKPKGPSVKVENKSKEKAPAKTKENDPFAFANNKVATQKSIEKDKKKEDDFLTKPAKNGAVKSDDEFDFVKKIQKKESLTKEEKNIEDDFLGSPKKVKKKEITDFSDTEPRKTSNNKLDF